MILKKADIRIFGSVVCYVPEADSRNVKLSGYLRPGADTQNLHFNFCFRPLTDAQQ